MTTTWLVLTATLPTRPSGLRFRVWRALKATGAGTLREGVYVLPEFARGAKTLRELERTIAGAGADAHLLVLQARDSAQAQTFRALFDRSALYAEFLQSVKEARGQIKKASGAELHKAPRSLRAEVQARQVNDFFPGKDRQKAAEALAALRREIEGQLAPDEPAATEAAVPPRAISDYQGRTWATRERPWIDRLATAWLVQRFIDKTPRFIWLTDAGRCPRSALDYAFDGTTFTHVGDKVTFEVLAQSFGVLDDPALQQLAGLVHYIDVGGIPVDEAPGFEMLIRGLQAQHAGDDALLAAAVPAFDACYVALQVLHGH
jgi:hypothetical protein